MPSLGRLFIVLGLLFLVVGFLAVGLSRFNIPIGRLPGDLRWRGKGWSVYFPIATSVLLSIFLTLIFWIINRFRR